MSMARRFHGAPVRRLIISVPLDVVQQIDAVARGKHPARGNRSEFLRLAIAEKLQRDTSRAPEGNLMIFGPPKETAAFENNPDQSNGGRRVGHDDAGGTSLRTEAEQADARGGHHAER